MWASFQLAAATTVAVMSVISKFGHYFSMQLYLGGGVSLMSEMWALSPVYTYTQMVPLVQSVMSVQLMPDGQIFCILIDRYITVMLMMMMMMIMVTVKLSFICEIDE